MKRSPSMRETVPQKARRLVNNYRAILTGPATAVVIGDHDTYRLTRTGQGWACECPWYRFRGRLKPCSHVLAVLDATHDLASQRPVSKLATMLCGPGGGE